ncbi:MAG: hypothetical protein MUE69_03655 [Myxococcota bacterium]|jgi:hypothetical protein|nr:hypothetical protein [Myxococcota bacterium]
MRASRFLFLLLALGVACGDDDSRVSDAGPLSDASTPDDLDGDGISNADEGFAGRVDTDDDGTPDYLDMDSDDDGLPDSFEAGDDDVSTPPVDSDGDGTPDFRDLDSDGNGIVDSREGMGDVDGDGRPDARDPDDDGDRVSDVVEIDGRTEFPADADDDGIPDFRDPDGDDDTILDGDERPAMGDAPDTDEDGMPDWRDEDTDGDGYPDSVEAGDDDLFTPPVDTDEDGIPDFRDFDSDNDGLPDAIERDAGTDPLDEDSDDDGVSDLIEVGAGTDPLDGTESPRTRGDFVFVVPFVETPEPERDTLEFRTNIQFADAYFLFDTTGSMSTEIDSMKSAIVNVIDNLVCEDSGVACAGDLECMEGQVCSAAGTCIADPRIAGCIASLWTGVGVYSGNPNSYRNLLALQPDSAETQRRIPDRADGGGANETLFESVACVADPTACSGAECVPGGVGCPAYRADARRILITITDEPNQCTTCAVNTAAAAGSRLRAEDLVFVGVDADAGNSPAVPLQEIARQSNSFDASGEPLYVQGSEASVTSAVTDAVRRIAENVTLFVNVAPEEVAGDDGDALPFIDRIEVNVSGDGDCTAVGSVADTDGDGFRDAFPNLLPGTPICWDVVARENDLVRPTARPQVFVARVVVRGDGSILDTRRVFFLVPPLVDRPVFE